MGDKIYELEVELRHTKGKESARSIRSSGKIPAIVYGNIAPPLMISVGIKEIQKKIESGTFLSKIATLKLEKEEIQVLPKDFQLHPVKDTPMHVDFLRVDKNVGVNVKVPLHFINEEKCPGVKRGGSLNIVSHEIDLHCAIDSVPAHILVDLTTMDIGHSLHISAIQLPENTKLVAADRDFTIATIVGGSAEAADSEKEKKDTPKKK